MERVSRWFGKDPTNRRKSLCLRLKEHGPGWSPHTEKAFFTKFPATGMSGPPAMYGAQARGICRMSVANSKETSMGLAM